MSIIKMSTSCKVSLDGKDEGSRFPVTSVDRRRRPIGIVHRVTDRDSLESYL